MGDKNESIFLWLLEEDRKKNRTRVLKEAYERSAPRSQNTAPYSSFSYDEKCRNENRQASTGTADLEQLMKEKVELETESTRLDEQEKKLEVRARTLCERVIREIRKSNLEKQRAVNQLRERIERMETRLGLENAIQETKAKNGKKQQEVSQLQELVGFLDSQFREIAPSNAVTDCYAEKAEDSHDTRQLNLPETALRKERIESHDNTW
jgi:hypothetical protein